MDKPNPGLSNPFEHLDNRLDELTERLSGQIEHLAGQIKEIQGTVSRLDEDGTRFDRLTTTEALDILRPRFTSVQSLTQACRRGSLPHSKEGRFYVFSRKELLDWLQDGAPDLAKQRAEDEAANYLVNGVRSWEK